MNEAIAWLNALPTWAAGGIFLGVLVVVLLIASQFSGFWTAGTRGGGGGVDFDGDGDGDGGGDGGGD